MPEAFIELFTGANTGKAIVKVWEPISTGGNVSKETLSQDLRFYIDVV